MAFPLLEHGEVEAEFGPVPAGSVIIMAEVGVFDTSDPPQLTNQMMSAGEQWTIEMADYNKPEGERIWAAVHYTGTTTGEPDYFNGITDTNRSIDFFTSSGPPGQKGGFIYRVRKTAGTDVNTNTNVAMVWDVGTTRQWV